MIITGFGDKKRACFNDSDSSQSSDLSDANGSNYSYESGNNKKLVKEKNRIIKYTG